MLAAAVFVGLIVQLFAQHGTVAGWLLDALLLALALCGASVLLPVVPAAVVERLGPRAAFARAAALTEGNRNRVLGIVLVMALTWRRCWALADGSAGPVGRLGAGAGRTRRLHPGRRPCRPPSMPG